jgi:CDP-paratose 2-epimerase
MKQLLVTGSSGLIGSEVCVHFAQRGWQVQGLDNNQRAVFFGPQGDTRWNQQRLQEQLGTGYQHIELDIRDRQGVLAMMAELRPDAIVHTAAQPSHDRAAAIPFDDFDTNAVGTLNLLVATRPSPNNPLSLLPPTGLDLHQAPHGLQPRPTGATVNPRRRLRAR